MKKSILLASLSVILWVAFIILSSPSVGFMQFDMTEYSNMLFKLIAKEVVYCLIILITDMLSIWSIIELLKSKHVQAIELIAFAILSLFVLLTSILFPYALRFDVLVFDITATLVLGKMILATIILIRKLLRLKNK